MPRAQGGAAVQVPMLLHMRFNTAAYWQHQEQAPMVRHAALENACAHMHASAAAQAHLQVGMMRDLQLTAWGWSTPPRGARS